MELEALLKLPPEEILKHNERPSADDLRNREQLYYDDVREEMELPKYIYQPTPTHLFRWSAGIENWHRIHYDLDFAINHDKLPSILIQGSWKQSVVPQYLKDWTLPDGWPWKASFQHRAMLVPRGRTHHVGEGRRKAREGRDGLRRPGHRDEDTRRDREHARHSYRGSANPGRPPDPISLRATPGMMAYRPQTHRGQQI